MRIVRIKYLVWTTFSHLHLLPVHQWSRWTVFHDIKCNGQCLPHLVRTISRSWHNWYIFSTSGHTISWFFLYLTVHFSISFANSLFILTWPFSCIMFEGLANQFLGLFHSLFTVIQTHGFNSIYMLVTPKYIFTVHSFLLDF